MGPGERVPARHPVHHLPAADLGHPERVGGVAADGSAYKLVNAVAADTIASTILCMTLHQANESISPVGILVLNPYGGYVVEIPYTGTAPTVGQSIAVSAADVRKVVGATWGRGLGTIMKVDTARVVVEVLFD